MSTTPPRILVLQSLPSLCAVCGGKQGLRVVHGTSPSGAKRGATTRCPHCVDRLPVVHLPMRVDVPRGDAA